MPRSPSRDRSDPFIGHRRYFRAWNPVERWKMWLSGFALLGVAGWAVASFVAKRDTQFQITHGPLTESHAAWDNQCDACHRNDGGSLFDARGKWNAFTCEKCHAAPAHAASIPADDAVSNCASCHHDHQGRSFSLVKMADSHCVRCHSQLDSSKYLTKVTDFATDHPGFSSLGTRKSTMKFSHAQHMTPGVVLTAGAKNALTLDKIPAEFRDKYRPDEKGLVQLDCKSCHSLDSGSRSDGKYFAPIKFEEHCKACHDTSAPSMPTSLKQVVDPFPVPHGKQPDELKKWIEAVYSKELQGPHKTLFTQPNPFDSKRKDEPAVKAFKDDVSNSTTKAMTFLDSQCRKCHDVKDNVVAAAKIPTVWLEHAMFNHASHKMAECKSCHPNAYEPLDASKPDYEREPVNIKGIDTCRECHSPASTFTSPKSGERFARGGVRHGCTDCHRFHGGDQPLHGRGNPIRFPGSPMTVEEIIRGKP